MSVIVETTIGDVVIDLFVEERPRASLNFLKLCKVKFYNYSLFHFVQRDFLAQTGDPSGSGQGGESIFRSLYGDQARYFEAEIKPRLKHVKKGTVSMVNNGNDMHGSQFFITLGDNLDYLDGQHTVFGEVAEGFDILDKLNEAICDEQHRPYQDIRITHTVILDDPFDDPSGLKIPDRSPEPTKEQLDSGRIGADEEVDDTKGKTVEEIQEMIEDRELKAGTQILEMVGDIPDADIKPPENVLFVCKLNPVTTDEDLEIIFSRFGPVKSCEIIKDTVSKESLQYAFIEYENVEDCERAYFKMDNVLIDDRRIHVDFSQSVAKLVHNKPGSKPVYQLIDKREDKPKLKIKDSSRKEKYDLVFEASDSDSSKRKHSKKDRRSSSEESSPELKRKRGKADKKRDKRRHGNDDVERQSSPDDRREKSRPGDRERPGKRDGKRVQERESEEHRDRRRNDDKHRSRKREKSQSSDEEYDKGSAGKREDKGLPRKREDRDRYSRSKLDRYVEDDRDKWENERMRDSEDREHYRRKTTEDRDSKGDKDRNRDKGKHKGMDDERASERNRRRQRHDSEERVGRKDHEERKGKREKARDKRDRSSCESDEEYQKKKRKDNKKEEKTKRKYRDS